MDVFGWSFWMLEHQRRKAEKCIDGFLDLIEPLSNGHSYQNYPNRKTPAHRYPELYWGDNYPRLQRAKARYDPDPLFRFEQMVHPPKPT
jgi:FAD/FMN-containing dehydrogenase